MAVCSAENHEMAVHVGSHQFHEQRFVREGRLGSNRIVLAGFYGSANCGGNSTKRRHVQHWQIVLVTIAVVMMQCVLPLTTLIAEKTQCKYVDNPNA